jgi:hypothetical protein
MGWFILLMLVAATPAVFRIYNNVETNVDADVDVNVDCCGDE